MSSFKKRRRQLEDIAGQLLHDLQQMDTPQDELDEAHSEVVALQRHLQNIADAVDTLAPELVGPAVRRIALAALGREQKTVVDLGRLSSNAAEAIAAMERMARLQPTAADLTAGLERISRQLTGRQTLEDVAAEAKREREHTAAAFLRALADLLETYQATLGYSTDDRGVEIDVAGVEVAAIWCNDPASGAKELRAHANLLEARP